MEDLYTIEEILEKAGGLFCTTNKLSIKNRQTFSMIDSPGVGACCKKILEDPEKSFTLTNRSNSMFVLTDGSGFLNYSKSNWNNDYGFIFVESKSYYYKASFDIDCYPLLMHHFKCNSAKDIYDLLYNFDSTYAAVEIYNISKQKHDDLLELIKKSPLELMLIMDEHRAIITDKLKNLNCYEFHENFIIGILARASIDY
jgi:malate dehydrogenase (oxaloacetate-decarboxylating)